MFLVALLAAIVALPNSAAGSGSRGQILDLLLDDGADLSLAKAADPDPVTVGAQLSYTLTVSNAGPDAASDVVVTDPLPADVDYVSAGGDGSCGEDQGTVTCSAATLASSSSAVFTIVVEPRQPGQLVNNASVTATTADPQPDNNSATVTSQVDAERSELPNIVVVIADDHPALDGRLLDHMPKTKSIFVDHGVTFSEFHAETPLCCPARAGFLTGQHTHNHGVSTNRAAQFNPTETLATELSGLGYQTMLVGKYMNKYAGTACKKQINCAPTVPAGWDRWAAFGEPAYYNYDLWTGDAGSPATAVHYGSAAADYSTRVIGDLADEMIAEAPADKPIFAWIATYGPHVPSTPEPGYSTARCAIDRWKPENFNELDVSDKPAYVRSRPLLNNTKGIALQRACRALLSVDDVVGGVRDALAAAGRLDNTIFVYSGDNGMNEGEHRLLAKSAPYETRVPFFLSWPARLGTEPRTISERLENIDFAPTMCELVGCTMGTYPNGQADPDGLSFAPLLLGQVSTLGRDRVLDELTQAWSGTPRWNAITTTSSSALAYEGCFAAASGGCRWHYVEYPSTGERELYDDSNGPCWKWSLDDPGDPCELQNVVDDPAYATIAAILHNELSALKTQRGEP